MSKNLTNESFPFIEDIEQSLFRGFLQERKMWVDFKDHISTEYFNKSEHASVFKIFKVFFKKYVEFPSEQQCLDIAKRKKFKGDVEKVIKNIYDSPDLKRSELDYLYDECGTFIKNNKIQNAILESVSLLEQQKFLEIEEKIKLATAWNNQVELGVSYSENVAERFAALE